MPSLACRNRADVVATYKFNGARRRFAVRITEDLDRLTADLLQIPPRRHDLTVKVFDRSMAIEAIVRRRMTTEANESVCTQPDDLLAAQNFPGFWIGSAAA